MIHQPKYSMFEREPENGLLDVLLSEGIGCIVFSPLARDCLPIDTCMASLKVLE
jgi:L-glyceraldehyde 3-phosphate reductase